MPGNGAERPANDLPRIYHLGISIPTGYDSSQPARMNELPNPYEAPTEPLETSRNVAQRTGRMIVLVHIFLVLAISVAISVLAALIRGPENVMSDVIRFVLTAALCYGVYRGSRIAKGITIFLLGIASLILIFGLSRGGDPVVLVIQGTMMAVYASFVFVLLFSPSVEAFLASRAGRR